MFPVAYVIPHKQHKGNSKACLDAEQQQQRPAVINWGHCTDINQYRIICGVLHETRERQPQQNYAWYGVSIAYAITNKDCMTPGTIDQTKANLYPLPSKLTTSVERLRKFSNDVDQPSLP